MIGDCWTLQRKNAKSSNALTGRIGPTVNENEHVFSGQNMSKFDYALDSYKPFISEGSVSVIGDKETSKPVTILRNTGAIQSLMLSDVLTLSDNTDTCTKMLIQGVEMGCVSAPLHNVNLISDIYSGPVTVAVRPSLPVEGVTFILGNDIAG